MNYRQAITACAFTVRNGRLLIARRAATKSFLPGVYELPGGHVEFGETMEEGLTRELREELHIGIVVGLSFYAFTYLSDSGTLHNIEVDYFAKMKNPDEKIRLNPDDHSAYKWISENEIDTYFDDNDREKRAVQKGFQLLKNI